MKVDGSNFARLSIVAAQNQARRERESAAIEARNRYEAAQPATPDRGWIPQFVRDARYDANSWTRWEMFRKIVYYEANTYLIGRLADEYVKWTVGPNGMPVVPASSDGEWNKAMLDSYQEFCEAPFLDSTLTMPQGHRLMARNKHLFGEMFIGFTRSKLIGRPARPAIQFIESPRCSSPGTSWSTIDDQTIVDGVQLGRDALSDQLTKPIGYHIRDSFMGDEWNFRTTEEMLHILDPTRVGMFRGITPYHATLPTVQDLTELEMLEMQKARQAAENANVIKNAAGEINTLNVRRNAMGLHSQTAAPNDSPDMRLQMYKKVLGARTIALKSGEEIQQFSAASPSAMTQWLWRYKIGQVAAAANVPLILVFPELIESMQGTVVRGIYDNAHQYFRGEFHVLATAAQRMYRFYANWARYNDPRCVDAPADWNRCTVTPPRAVNVDIGRNSAAMLAEWAAGSTNLTDIAGGTGTTAEILARKKAHDVALIKRVAKEVSAETGEEVSPEEIMGNLADLAAKLAQANATQETEDEPALKKTKDQNA